MQDILQRLTSSLMQSYDAHGGINHLDGVNLPSKSIIADITKDLLTLLFPGFFQEKLIHSQQLKTETHQLVEKASVEQVQDGMFYSSNILVNWKPLINFLSNKWFIIKICTRISQEIP